MELSEQFGMSEREQAEIRGTALGAHLWEGMEGVLGDMSVGSQSAAYDDLSHRFGVDNVRIDSESDDPFFEVGDDAGYALRYHGGPTYNFYKGGQNVSASEGNEEHGAMLSSDFSERLKSWVDEEGYGY